MCRETGGHSLAVGEKLLTWSRYKNLKQKLLNLSNYQSYKMTKVKNEEEKAFWKLEHKPVGA